MSCVAFPFCPLPRIPIHWFEGRELTAAAQWSRPRRCAVQRAFLCSLRSLGRRKPTIQYQVLLSSRRPRLQSAPLSSHIAQIVFQSVLPSSRQFLVASHSFGSVVSRLNQ